MRKPRKLKMSWNDWSEANSKALMKEYVITPTKVLWMAWLKSQYEVYRGQ